jgi:hypothetical protein
MNAIRNRSLIFVKCQLVNCLAVLGRVRMRKCSMYEELTKDLDGGKHIRLLILNENTLANTILCRTYSCIVYIASGLSWSCTTSYFAWNNARRCQNLGSHYVYPCQRFSTGNTLEDYNP